MTTQNLKQSWLVRRSPVFYGWVVWLFATIGLSASSPGQSFSVSLFIDHYITDFGISRTTVSGLYGLGTFIAALSLTWIGQRIDRHGNRMMAVMIALAFAFALMLCSLITGPFTIFISFIAIRFLGQGSMSLVNTTVVAQWFKRRRGWVMGLSLVGFAVFQRFYLPALQDFIAVNGWRTAWIMLGVVMMVVVAPLLALFIRNRPEDFGMMPDGDALPDPDDVDVAVIPEVNHTLREALRTPVLYVYTSARMLAGAWGTALIFHQLSLFEGLGHSEAVAASTYGQAALMTAAFTLFFGWLVDRLHPGYLIAIHMLGLLAATGLAMVMESTALLFLYTVAYGIFMGVGSVFDSTVWVNLFGRRYQGAIRGFVATANVIGTSLGPIAFGLSYDFLGSYTPSLWLGIGLAILAMIAGLIVKMPERA